MKRAEELALRWLDGELTEAEAGELDALLTADAEASRRVAAMLELEFALRGAAHEVHVADAVLQTVRQEVGERIAARVVEEIKLDTSPRALPFGSASTVDSRGPMAWAAKWRWAAALAASLALLTAVGLIYRSSSRQASVRESREARVPPAPGVRDQVAGAGKDQPPPAPEGGGQEAIGAERLPVGRIVEAVGKVWVSDGKGAMPTEATPGVTLSDGMQVLTEDSGSRCKVDVAAGNVGVTVYGNSALVLRGDGPDSYYHGEVEMKRGELEAEVRRKGTPFAVSTAAGKAEAIGTRFRVKLLGTEEKESEMKRSQTVMLTTVLSGIVLVSNPLGSITARADDTVSVTANGAPVKVAREAAEQPSVAKMTLTGTLTKEAQMSQVNPAGKVTYFLTVADNGNGMVARKVTVTSSQAVNLDAFVDKVVKVTVTQTQAQTVVTAIEEVTK